MCLEAVKQAKDEIRRREQGIRDARDAFRVIIAYALRKNQTQTAIAAAAGLSPGAINHYVREIRKSKR